MTETIRYSLIGKQDLKLEPRNGTFEVTLADGRVVVLDAVDIAYLLGDNHAKGSLPQPGIAGRLARVTDSTRGLWMDSGAVWSPVFGGFVNVKDFGVVGDAVADDTTALQAAIDACPDGGTIVVPVGNRMRVTASIKIHNRVGVTFRGSFDNDTTTGTGQTGLVWDGASGGTILSIQRSREILVEGLGFRGTLNKPAPGVGVDIDMNVSGTLVTTNVTLRRCFIYSTVSSTTFVGVRIGETATTNTDNILIDRCVILAGNNRLDGVGVRTNNQNTHNTVVRDTVIQNASTGVQIVKGSGLRWIGGFMATIGKAFKFQAGGSVNTIERLFIESYDKLIETTAGSQTNIIRVVDCDFAVSDATPTAVIDLPNSTTTLIMIGNHFQYDAAQVTFAGDETSSIISIGNIYFNLANIGWAATFADTGRVSLGDKYRTSSTAITATPRAFTPPALGTNYKARTAAAGVMSAVIDAALGSHYRITVNDTTAFTIAAPTNPTTGQELRISVLNSAGAAMGLITWNGAFKLDATGWTNPADTKQRAITFVYDGTSWFQVCPITADA